MARWPEVKDERIIDYFLVGPFLQMLHGQWSRNFHAVVVFWRNGVEYPVLVRDHAAKVSWPDSINGCLPTCIWSPSEKFSVSQCLAALTAVGVRETVGVCLVILLHEGLGPDNVGTSGRKL